LGCVEALLLELEGEGLENEGCVVVGVKRDGALRLNDGCDVSQAWAGVGKRRDKETTCPAAEEVEHDKHACVKDEVESLDDSLRLGSGPNGSP
jgi:hypothetical protein